MKIEMMYDNNKIQTFSLVKNFLLGFFDVSGIYAV